MAGNFQKTYDEIKALIDSSKVDGQSVDLLAVSKKQSLETIKAFYDLGQRDFGENYLQEALQKVEALKDFDIRWHYIGQLQSKKIKDIVGRFDLIQTVCRDIELEKISQVCENRNIQQKILIQVNVAGEESKQGVELEALPGLIERARQLPGILLVGLMVFPPLEDSEDKARHWFKKSKALFDQFSSKEFSVLSMGTSGDFPWAISEGATLVRVGERLMGNRSSQ